MLKNDNILKSLFNVQKQHGWIRNLYEYECFPTTDRFTMFLPKYIKMVDFQHGQPLDEVTV